MKASESNRIAALHHAYQEGRSLQEVGTMFGITRQAVHKLFKKHGILTRGHDYRAAKAAASGRNCLETDQSRFGPNYLKNPSEK